MPDNSAIVVLPTNKISVYVTRQAGFTCTYAQLVALSPYSGLVGKSYGQLQNLAATSAEVVVLPTNKVTVYLSKERQLATYTSIFSSWGTTYAALAGHSYGQLEVVP